ncbi:hypothetical protein D3C87_1575100 [compost metagenome]
MRNAAGGKTKLVGLVFELNADAVIILAEIGTDHRTAVCIFKNILYLRADRFEARNIIAHNAHLHRRFVRRALLHQFYLWRTFGNQRGYFSFELVREFLGGFVIGGVDEDLRVISNGHFGREIIVKSRRARACERRVGSHARVTFYEFFRFEDRLTGFVKLGSGGHP